jgi:uncharacterized membrane protein
MRRESSPLTDRRMELFIGAVLRAGVIVAGALVAAGGAMLLVHGASTRPDFSAFAGEPESLRHVAAIAREALSFHALGIIQLGLVVLITVPIVRVAVSLAAFAVRRDWLYAAITLLVLGLLVASLVAGR